MNKNITVQLVDDHELVRTGFKHMLEDKKHIKVIAESCNGQEAISDYVKTKPDIVLMDVSMPGMSGLDATRHILTKNPDAKIVILSMHGRDVAVRAMEAGAKGFLSKSSAAAEIITAMNSIMLGHAYIDRETAQQIAIDQLNGAGTNPLKELSTREYEIFVHMANSVSVDDIATRCCLSPKTVRSHKSHIMQKLGLNNTVDFVRLAIRAGIIEN